jgi:hypothetical protein
MASILDRVFDDKRVAISVLMVWLVVVLISFNTIGLFHSDFMRFGPSSTTKIMTLTIQTWHDWWLVAMASFLSTCVNDFFGDSLSPFFLNTIQDHKTKYLPYSKTTCYIILQLWSTYCCLMSIFSVGLLMSQIDFLLIRLIADLMVNTFTTFKFLKGKEVNFRMYEAEGNHQLSQKPSSSSLHDAAQELTDVLGESDDSTQPLNGSERP